MITDSTIVYLSHKLQTTDLNIRREYLQNVFLSYFYRHPKSDKIYFKGGTALRLVYNSPRFSEDLDFSSTSITIKNIEDIIIETIKEIEREGIVIDIKESKKTTGGYLAIINFFLHGRDISIKIEISQRKEKNTGEVVVISSDYIPPYSLVVMKKDQLVKGKINALLDRHKARDFYDLYFILRSYLLPAGEKKVLEKVLKLLDEQDIQFNKELKAFLPQSHWGIIKNFKSSLKQEIKRLI